MKIKYLIISILSAALLLTSCNDLDTLPLGNEVTSKQKEEVYDLLAERAESGVNAVFAQFNQYMPNYDALGKRERHNDFGYPSIMMFTDANGFDVVSEDNGYNWAGNSLSFDDRVFTSFETQIVWNNLYSMIYASNAVVGTIDPATTDPQSQYFLAQGHGVRAFSYFLLVQLYQFNYVGNESKPAVPIITNENSDEAALEGAPRATVEEVYNLILSDINKSVELLEAANEKGVTRSDRRYFDAAVAYGLRARINLTMQKWSDAANDAKKAIALTDAKPTTHDEAAKPAFSDIKEKNWMWGIIVSESDDVVSSGIVNWISHMGSFNNGYASHSGGKQISTKLFNSIANSDVRRGWWIDADGMSANLTKEQQSTITNYGFKPYTQVKFAPYKGVMEQSINANDMPLMRVEEMYLIQAEAEAMTGGGTATLTDFVKTYRDPRYAFQSGDPKEIQEEVFRQKRIELWGEGLSWYDIMRLNKGVDRRGCGFPNNTMIFNIPAGDPILLWRIPQKEIIANPALSDADNNDATPLPTPVSDN